MCRDLDYILNGTADHSSISFLFRHRFHFKQQDPAYAAYYANYYSSMGQQPGAPPR